MVGAAVQQHRRHQIKLSSENQSATTAMTAVKFPA